MIRLIARDAELEALVEALDDVQQGTGCVRVVAGDAGMGKTRLARELSRRAQERNCAVLWGECRDSEFALPFLPFYEAIDDYLTTASVAEFREHLGSAADAVGAVVPKVATGAPPLSDLLGPASRLALFEGIVAVLHTVATPGRALMVIEDVQWADASTRALIDFVARRTHKLPLLLLVTYRSDHGGPAHPVRVMLEGWRRAGLANTTALSPLTRDDVRRLISARLGAERVSSDMVDMLMRRSEGVPFVVEELLEAAIRSQLVVLRDGECHCSNLASLHLPKTLAIGVLQRLDRLRPEHQRVVMAAAVLGSTFRPNLLTELTGLPAEVVSAALKAASRAQLVETETADQTLQLRFRHALTYEAVRDAVPVWEATTLHSRAADALAEAAPPMPLIERCRHLLAAGREADAAPLCAHAAEIASRAGAFAEAAMLWEHALVNVVDPAERGHFLYEQGRMFLASGRPAAAVGPLQECADLLSEAGSSTAAKPLIVLGFVHLALGEQEAALNALDRARPLLETAPGPDLALLYARMAMWHHTNLESEVGLALSDRALTLAEQCHAEDARAAALISRGAGLCELGRRDEGLEVLDRGIAEAVRLRLPEEFGGGVIISAFQKALAMRASELSSLVDLIRNRAGTLNVGPTPEVLAALVEALASRFLATVEQTEAAIMTVIEGSEAVPYGISTFLGREILAWVRIQQGRLSEAEALLPNVVPRGNWWYRICGPTRLELAMARAGDPKSVAKAAKELLARAPVLAEDPLVVSTVVPALLAAGAEAEAYQCVSTALEKDRHPFSVGAAADLAAYRGESNDAATLYREAADAAWAAGYHRIAAGYRSKLEKSTNLRPKAAPALTHRPAQPPLSKREMEILTLLAEGQTDEQIAGTLVISLRTVRSHLDRIRNKTRRRRRPQLTVLAIELGLLRQDATQMVSTSREPLSSTTR